MTETEVTAEREPTGESVCPVCGHEGLTAFWEAKDVPIFCNILCESREEALAVPRAGICLAVCRSCGFICNTKFDSSRIDYDQSYENALEFSPRFREYAERLANRLIETYGVRGKHVIEIACGDGYFLNLLSRLGGNTGVGFDPSYRRTAMGASDQSGVTIIADYYGEKYADQPADLICCRHALEHMANPVGFVQTIRQSIGQDDRTIVFFEVPDTMFIFRDLSVWDIIYEHCCYFTVPSLVTTFHRAGFDVDWCESAYDGQFLTIAARPAIAGVKPFEDSRCSLANVLASVERFAGSCKQKCATWASQFGRIASSGSKALLWGAGSKGITILNTLRESCGERGVDYVVDINERKQGKYIAGTGQKIVAPAFLTDYRPDVVIVMNPVYLNEIEGMVASLGLTCEFLVA